MWEEVLDFALGELGLDPHAFYCMTWADYLRRSQGYWLRNSRYLEGCRMVAHAVLVAAGGRKVPAAYKIWPLITDPKIVIKQPTKEESKEIFNRYKKAWQTTTTA
ncbi:hypothetical protein DCC81_24790 [Chitinophaga parva]|uniref:Uncharacterized protein n=1 Tax=Chitinophaga parva TaxID=2169414 RepID=A0A2T7BBV3_9BACT|nr:hypothetical protein [Chitinophaga parva]PUZ21808.1 hypothetical protein DCC81_24790 [Chitinophaga parva]